VIQSYLCGSDLLFTLLLSYPFKLG